MIAMQRRRLSFSSVLSVVPWIALLGPVATTSHATSPDVAFDVSYTVACRDVTPATFATLYPDTKVIEAKFRVSVFFKHVEEEDVEELIVRMESPERRLRVSDFAPRTELASDVDGQIEIVEKVQKASSLDVSLGGALTVAYDVAKGTVSPSAGAGTTRRDETEERYKKLPPLRLVLASGTTNREHGVFFKLRPSTQSSLEGMHEFACLFAVPADWRADWALVSCTARGRERSYVFSSREEYGHEQTYVGLHVEGDPIAQSAAIRLAEAQSTRRHASGPARTGIVGLLTSGSGRKSSDKGSSPFSSLRRICARPSVEKPGDASAETQPATGSETVPSLAEALAQLRDLSGTPSNSDAVDELLAPIEAIGSDDEPSRLHRRDSPGTDVGSQ